MICYLISLGVSLRIGFVGKHCVLSRLTQAHEHRSRGVGLDLLLLSLFAIQHSVMARQWFKRAWTKVVPEPVERSTYVLLASLVLLLLFWQWRPIPSLVWDVRNPTGRIVLQGLFWIGWGQVLASTYLVDHFGLFGLKQVYRYLKGKPEEPAPFKTPALYKIVRHPLYLGFIIAFWSTPRMTVGHLLFAAVCAQRTFSWRSSLRTGSVALLGETIRGTAKKYQ